ncbi:hypothetical protein [Kribbella sp.]|uniref:hypothetical protein n=1 Tax=Kribbella sp. TaxID=1871183 RepID=UPI002D4849ED|nr:hypothetical protein [Kribbella sp.]HZX07668.1 hypothetical protein [Kribbella sp.]
MARGQQSGGQANGGYSEQDSKNLTAALGGLTPPGSGGDSKNKGEKPKTGKLRDIGKALDGRE